MTLERDAVGQLVTYRTDMIGETSGDESEDAHPRKQTIQESRHQAELREDRPTLCVPMGELGASQPSSPNPSLPKDLCSGKWHSNS